LRCWWHKIGSVLAALLTSVHPAAKKVIAEIYAAADKTRAPAAAQAFAAEFGGKEAQAAAKITDDLDVLLAFYDYRPNTGSTCRCPASCPRGTSVVDVRW